MAEPGGRIKVVAYMVSSAWGGAEMSFNDLVSRLPEYIELTVMASQKAAVRQIAAQRPRTQRKTVRRKPFGFLNDWLVFWRLKPEIIYVSRNVPWAGAGTLTAALLVPSARVVVVDHLSLRTVKVWQMWRTRFLTLRADVSAAVSRDAAKRLEDFYALGRGLVVPLVNGIADEDILPASPVRGDSQAVLKIIAVGKIGPRKAFDVLIKAAAKTENAEVVIFGDGSRDDLESLADQLGVADRLSFAGWSEHPPYEKFNVFVQTSQAESFGRALAEAMMAKLPVITTPVGDVGRVVEESKAGLVIPVGGVDELAAAMERLKSDVKFRNYLAEKGFELAKRNFTIERCVADHLRLWQQLLDQPRKSRLFVRHLKA